MIRKYEDDKYMRNHKIKKGRDTYLRATFSRLKMFLCILIIGMIITRGFREGVGEKICRIKQCKYISYNLYLYFCSLTDCSPLH
jgi:hypothetical protein